MSSRTSQTKAKILAAALKLLSSNAGKDVRMSDIAKLAGVSRQAIYLNFDSRTDLMVATVQFSDEINGAQEQVKPWRDAKGVDKLDAWIGFWGNYLPQTFGVAKALMLARETDEAAEAAWQDRMSDIRRSCQKTIQALADDGRLDACWKVKPAAEMLWTLLSIASYEQLIVERGWTTKQYVKNMRLAARQMFVGQ